VSKLTYTAQISGHRAPFKWKVRNPENPNNVRTGEEDTYEDALIAAHQAARSIEENRVHEHTRRDEHLFDVDKEIRVEDDPSMTLDTSEFM
jgi:hypothetical protein